MISKQKNLLKDVKAKESNIQQFVNPILCIRVTNNFKQNDGKVIKYKNDHSSTKLYNIYTH